MDSGVMMSLPIGFRFRPTDVELVAHYLRRKALSLPLPAPVIHHFDVFLSHPNSFPGDVKEKRRFYFCEGSKAAMINLTATGCGFWKTNGTVKQIVVSTRDGRTHVLGTKILWAFYQKSGPHGWSRTPWVMHQFQLPHSTQGLNGEMQEWGVCKVFQRKRRPNKMKSKSGYVDASKLKNFFNGGGFELPSYIDFKLEENSTDFGPPQPLSASSPTTEMAATGTGTSGGKEEEQLTSQASV